MKKKLIYSLLAILMCVAVFIPALMTTSYAETSKTIIADSNTHNVNLLGVNDFAINGSKVYLAHEDKIDVYDMTTKSLSEYTTLEDIVQIQYVNNNLVVICQDKVILVDSSLNKYQFSGVTDFDSIDVTYVNSKYVIAYVKDSTLTVLTYTTPTAHDTSVTQALSHTNYYISISGENAYLLHSTSYEMIQYTYTNGLYSPLTHVNINFVNKNNFLATDSHFIVVMTDIISILDRDFNKDSTNMTPVNSERAYINGEIDSVKSMKYYNDKLYILDGTNLDIQSFDIENNKLVNGAVILGSFGANEDRYFDVNDIAIKSDDYLIISDNGNSRIKFMQDQMVFVQAKAHSLTLDEYNNLYYLVNDTTYSTLHKYSLSSGQDEEYVLTHLVVSMSIDSSNNLYMLADDEIIYKTNANDISLTAYVNLNTLSIATNSTSIIKCLPGSNGLVVSNDSVLYLINTANSINVGDNIVDYDVDFEENIFVLTESGNITKCNFNNNTTTSIGGYTNSSAIAVNKLNGTLYVFDNTLSALYQVINTDFSNGMGNFEHYDTTILNNGAKNYIYNYANIDGLIFEYPNYIGQAYNTDGSITQVVLVTNERSTTGFEYVMFEHNGQLVFGYAKTSDLTINAHPITQNPTNILVINNSINVYKHPSIHSPVSLATYNKSKVINTYTTYPTTLNGRKYYVVNIDGGYGYIYAGDVTAYDNNYNQNVDVDNAYVTTHDHTSYVPVYESNDGGIQIDSLNRGKRVYVLDYDKSKPYTLIKYLDDYGKEKMGYVATKYVHQDSNKAILISAIVTLVLGLIAATILITNYVKYKKNSR